MNLLLSPKHNQGWNPDTRYSEHFLQEAKLLHWNGRHKPWDFPSVHNDLWESWFVPDPAGIFKLHHPNSWCNSTFKIFPVQICGTVQVYPIIPLFFVNRTFDTNDPQKQKPYCVQIVPWTLEVLI